MGGSTLCTRTASAPPSQDSIAAAQLAWRRGQRRRGRRRGGQLHNSGLHATVANKSHRVLIRLVGLCRRWTRCFVC